MQEQKITSKEGKLQVADIPAVPFIEGEVTRPDGWKTSAWVMDVAVEKADADSRRLTTEELTARKKAFNQTGLPLSSETLEAFRQYHAHIKPIALKKTEKLVRTAIQYVLNKQLTSVTLVHKGDFMKFTEGTFKKWDYEPAECEFSAQLLTWAINDRTLHGKGPEAAVHARALAMSHGKLQINDMIADAFLQQKLLRPGEYRVSATINLSGDYTSDALGAIMGGIGIAPGVNINCDTGHAAFQATHCTAPKYSNTDHLKLASVTLSGALMPKCGLDGGWEFTISGLEEPMQQKAFTYDLHRLMGGTTKLKTSEFGDAMIRNIKGVWNY